MYICGMTTEQLQRQITALRHKLNELVLKNAPSTKIFALNGKILKLQRTLDGKKFDDYLAK